MRGGTGADRADRPNMFYPVYIDPENHCISEVGTPLPLNTDRSTVPDRLGLATVWPLRTDGREGRWRLSADSLKELISLGYAKAGAYDASNDRWSILYLGRAQIKRIKEGHLRVTGRDQNGAVVLESNQDLDSRVIAKTVWNRLSHRAGENGSMLVKKFIPGRSFPFPKSLYAVEDTLRIMVGDNPRAIVLDFFAGSGTTAHALARLNAADNGARRCILVTNNEVSEAEASRLRSRGIHPGDPEWEELGIFHHVTRPRVEAAITGTDHVGRKLVGAYLDGASYANGFEENLESFDLTYEDPDLVSLGRSFETVAPLLWLKAGARGARIDQPNTTWSLPVEATYGILFEPETWRDFVDAVNKRPEITHVFIVTDSEAVFQQVASDLAPRVIATQLYEDYLHTFTINTEVR